MLASATYFYSSICIFLATSCWCFFFKQKTAYDMRISDWSSDVCSSDLKFSNSRAEALGRCMTCLYTLSAIDLNQPFQSFSDVTRGAGTSRTSSLDRKSVVAGKECGSTCSSRWSPYHSNKKHQHTHEP